MNAFAASAVPPRPNYAGRAIEIGFHLLGWGAVTLLAAGGMLVLVFAAFGNFTLDGFFLQVANLADRYGTADLARRSSFHGDLAAIAAAVIVGTAFFRRASLRHALAASKAAA